MALETLQPDVLITQTGLTGSVSDIQETDILNPDANWLTTNASSSVMRNSFGSPTGNPNTGVGLQKIGVRLRKDASGGGDPTFTLTLEEGGTLVTTLATDVTVTTIGDGTYFSYTWDAVNLSTADGSDVEVRIVGTKGGGGPNERNLEVGAVEWNVDYSAGAYLLETEVGSFILTGVDANLKTAYQLETEVGAFTLTGIDATLLTGFTLPIEVGSFVLSGVDAAFQRGIVLDATVGSFILNGIDVSLNRGYYLGTEVGSFTLTGIDVNLNVNVKLPSEVGSFVLTGINANLYNIAESWTWDSTHFTWDDTLHHTWDGWHDDAAGSVVLSVEVGSFILTGVDSSLQTAYQLEAEVGTFILTGVDVDLLTGFI